MFLWQTQEESTKLKECLHQKVGKRFSPDTSRG